MRRGLAVRLARITLLVAGAALGPLSAGASASNLLYYGGPVVHSANVVLVNWGTQVRSTYTASSTGDPAFFRYLAASDGSTSNIGGVLAQYMDTTSHNSQNSFSFANSFQISPTVGGTPPGTVNDSAIQTELAKDINSGSLPAPSGNGLSTVYVVLFPPGDNICFDGGGGCAYDATSGFCAYHGSFPLTGSTHVLYAAMVDNGPGTANYGYCGPSNVDLQNQTAVVSHELAETINDPLVAEAANYAPPLGWYDPTFNGEIADKCDAAPAATNGPWTVEPLWSNADGSCRASESAYSAPTASFQAPSTGAAEQPVSFDASSSSDPSQNHTSAFEQGVGKTFSIASGITRYSWNWGDGSAVTTSAVATAAHIYAAPGTYAVSLTVTDALGFTSTTTEQVAVTSAGAPAPVAQTGAATAINGQGATLNGTVNPEGQVVSYRFAYGTSSGSLNQQTPLTAGPGGTTPSPVSATLSGLAPSTTYYYQLEITAGGSTYTGSVQSFTTNASSPAPQVPVVATGQPARVGARGALLTGTVNPGGPASVGYAFSYGTSASSLGRTTPSGTQPGGTTAVPVTATLTSLHPSTTYYYRLTVTFAGHAYPGAVRSFTTLVPAPGAKTGAAHDITSNSAVVAGSVNPHGAATRYQIQFGATRAYGFSTTWTRGGYATASEQVSTVLLGLHPQTTYHFRLVAQSAGGTAVGADQTFTTARRMALAPRFRFQMPQQASLGHAVARSLRAHFTCSKACTAHFVLTVAPSGISRATAVPLTIARGQARLRRAGNGTVRLRLTSRFRHAVHRSADGPLRLIVLGYAIGAHTTASRPQHARVTLT